MNGEMACGSKRSCFAVPALPLPVETKKNYVNRSQNGLDASGMQSKNDVRYFRTSEGDLWR
jgi:hypothetical protein